MAARDFGQGQALPLQKEEMTMKLKHLVIAILVVVMSCVAIVAQQQRSDEIAKAATPDGRLRTSDSAAAPEFPAEQKLLIRDVQYRHAQRAAQMKTLEQQYEQLQKLQQEDAGKVDTIVDGFAKSASVDLAKWIFDIEDLKFKPRINADNTDKKKN